jgi:hypothetical protein
MALFRALVRKARVKMLFWGFANEILWLDQVTIEYYLHWKPFSHLEAIHSDSVFIVNYVLMYILGSLVELIQKIWSAMQAGRGVIQIFLLNSLQEYLNISCQTSVCCFVIWTQRSVFKGKSDLFCSSLFYLVMLYPVLLFVIKDRSIRSRLSFLVARLIFPWEET